MNFIKTHIPILKSPTFWGLTLAATFTIFELKEVMDPEMMIILRNWAISVTGVNIAWKFGKKVSGR